MDGTCGRSFTQQTYSFRKLIGKNFNGCSEHVEWEVWAAAWIPLEIASIDFPVL